MGRRGYRASLSQSQGREGWAVIFRHPLKADKATGKPGLRVRMGLGTSTKEAAAELVDQLNELLSDSSFWSLSARPVAAARFDAKVVDIFYRKIDPETWDFFALRDGVIDLPDSKSSDYKRVLFVGTTGSGKTTLVRQFLGTDPRTERFPSTSTAKTTVADTEIVLAEGSFRAVVTFMPQDQVRDYVEECISAAVLAAYLKSSDAEVRRRLLQHIDQRFRLSYMLGSGGAQVGDDLDDLDAEETDSLDFDEPETDDSEPRLDLASTNAVLSAAVLAARELAARHESRLKEDLSPTSLEDSRVIDEIFEDNLDHLLREDEQYFQVADSLMEEIERRFELLTPGKLIRTTQGWPKFWQWETNDRKAFIKAVGRFSSNYAPSFGTLLTPIVNGIRVAGPFQPVWMADRPRLVLIDGEGLGHTPDSASSLPTSVTTRFDSVDTIVLVDNGAQPMQAAPGAVMRSVTAMGQASKLIFCFTHFDQVVGDNLPTFSAKEEHILASAENSLRTLGEQLGPWAERALRIRLERASFFVGGIHEPLDSQAKRGKRSVDQLVRLLGAVLEEAERLSSGDAVAVYDKTDLILAIQTAAEKFHDGWRARLGKDAKPGITKEHWTRIKALSRRLAEGWADEYDNLKPVADLHLMLQQELYRELHAPSSWRGKSLNEDEKQVLFDALVNRLSADVMLISARRVQTEPVALWQDAYNQAGRGSSFVRATIISDRIYGPAAPTMPVPDRTAFLKEILDAAETAFEECSAEMR